MPSIVWASRFNVLSSSSEPLFAGHTSVYACAIKSRPRSCEARGRGRAFEYLLNRVVLKSGPVNLRIEQERQTAKHRAGAKHQTIEYDPAIAPCKSSDIA